MESTPQHRPKSHVVIAFVMLLSFATGLVLDILVNAGTEPRASEIVPESEVLTIGREYYRAVNVLLESGDDEELRNVLASDFRRGSFASPDSGDTDSLITELAARASLQDGLTLTIDAIASTEELVVANVRWNAANPALFAGLPVKTGGQETFQEILRVRDDLIVEQWANDPPEPLLNSMVTGEQMSFSDVPVLRLWHFDPGAYQALNSGDALVIVAESGSLTVGFDPMEEGSSRYFRSDFAMTQPVRTEPASGELVIRRGDLLFVTGRVELKISNLEENPATFFALSSETSGAVNVAPPMGSGPAAQSWIVARGEQIVGGTVPSSVSVGLAHLPEGESFAHEGLEAGSEFLISIDGGLTVTAPPSQIRTTDGRGQKTSQETATIATGNGAVILGATHVTYAPVEGRTCTFLVLTLVPERR